MKTTTEIFRTLEEAFVVATLAEMGVGPEEPAKNTRPYPAWEFVKQTFLKGVFAEVGEDLESLPGGGLIRKETRALFKPDDCHFGDNDICGMEA